MRWYGADAEELPYRGSCRWTPRGRRRSQLDNRRTNQTILDRLRPLTTSNEYLVNDLAATASPFPSSRAEADWTSVAADVSATTPRPVDGLPSKTLYLPL
jgi:hypothetical protein